jgi:hypothetical protein
LSVDWRVETESCVRVEVRQQPNQVVRSSNSTRTLPEHCNERDLSHRAARNDLAILMRPAHLQHLDFIVCTTNPSRNDRGFLPANYTRFAQPLGDSDGSRQGYVSIALFTAGLRDMPKGHTNSRHGYHPGGADTAHRSTPSAMLGGPIVYHGLPHPLVPSAKGIT